VVLRVLRFYLPYGTVLSTYVVDLPAAETARGGGYRRYLKRKKGN